MVAVFILVFAVLALLQFAVSQWRLIWLTTANQPLSANLRLAAGLDGTGLHPSDFSTLLDLCDELSPQIRKGTPWLREVTCYYRVMTRLERGVRALLPPVASWAASEMQTCARFVAVVLDQNLSLDLDRRAVGVRSV
jgi:hypothetical protein